MKRILFILFFLGLIPISCWNKDNKGYFEINNIAVNSYSNEDLTSSIGSKDSIINDKIYFKIDLDISYIASSKKVGGIINELYAFKKQRKGISGLKIKLTAINITSDYLFNGKQAGSYLDEFFSWHDTKWDNKLKSINDLKEKFNKSEFFLGESNYYLKLVLNQKPAGSLKQKFTFTFKYNDGHEQNTHTETLIWK